MHAVAQLVAGFLGEQCAHGVDILPSQDFGMQVEAARRRGEQADRPACGVEPVRAQTAAVDHHRHEVAAGEPRQP
ncbi:hypothetical protein RZS08_59835, partial [Arthrospira platensis SPKY1]|nr:hypothetical protein [Arthrospira platensis SPKY1]